MSGKLYVVGIGPGGREHMTIAALDALATSSVVVGYRPYVALVEHLLDGKRVLGSGMREEVERARAAIGAARDGENVAVVSTGDAGVYGMAGLVIELLGEAPDVDLEVVPGVTAASAAASVLGAPLMNDCAFVSLSDLLTPIDVIEKRVRAAAEGDFVLALYNPRSKTRVEPLERTLDALRSRRAPGTPVGVVRNALRNGQESWLTTLGEVDPESLDMSCIVIVGNASTIVVGGRMVAPRGYRV